MSQFRRLVVAAAVATTGACAHAANLAPSTSPLRHLDTAQRLDAIGRSQVWTATDVPAMDLRAGPQGGGAIAPFASVACNYVERKMDGDAEVHLRAGAGRRGEGQVRGRQRGGVRRGR